MNGFQSSLYTVAIALCVFSAGVLRSNQQRSGRPFAWFTTFLIIETLGFVFELLMIHPAAPLKALWLALRMGTSLLIAPCLWLAIKESVEGVRPKLANLGRGHWAAILGGFALLLPLIGSAHLGLDYSKPPGPVRPLHFAIHEAMLLCIGIFAVQVPYYLWQCHRLLLGANGSSKWLLFPLLVVLTTWLLGLLRTLQCIAHAPRELSLVFALTDVGVTVGAMYLIVRRVSSPERRPSANVSIAAIPSGNSEPALMSATAAANPAPHRSFTQTHPEAESIPVIVLPASFPEQPKPPAPLESSSLPADNQTSARPAKYARSHLDAATRERIRRKLATALATEAICSDSLLNLRSLSRSINEKAHYVSQVINQDLNTNFYELVNRHRIERAKQLLVDRPDQTVLELALTVGFNSKSTFNTAFRRHTGVTPTDYRTAALAAEQ